MIIKHKTISIFLCCIMLIQITQTITPTRVILATNNNPNYIQFWPIVAKAWKEIVGIKPTLALIAPPEIQIDEILGDVIRFSPIEGVPTALYAQCIRLLLPAYFENDVCIISDIDMIPLQRAYFIDSIQHIPDDHFVVYRSGAILEYKEYPMCYIAAKGSVFKELFDITTIEDIPHIIKKWSQLKIGWTTDQKLLYKYLNTWPKFKTHCDLLNVNRFNRIQPNSQYNRILLQQGKYTDYHCPRPYSSFKQNIDTVLAHTLTSCSSLKILS